MARKIRKYRRKTPKRILEQQAKRMDKFMYKYMEKLNKRLEAMEAGAWEAGDSTVAFSDTVSYYYDGSFSGQIQINTTRFRKAWDEDFQRMVLKKLENNDEEF